MKIGRFIRGVLFVVIGLFLFNNLGKMDLSAFIPTTENTQTTPRVPDSREISSTKVENPQTTPKEPSSKTSNNQSEKKKKPPLKADCGSLSFDLQDHLINFSKQIEEQNILYNSQNLSDCSGMFLRLCNSLREKCDQYSFPHPSRVRDTRLLGRWYYDNGKLELIEDASTAGPLIKPGAVLFFGHGGIKYTHLTIDKLTARNGIEHIGTVTSVTKDQEGNVIKYSLFHGRSSGKPAGRTTYHELEPSRAQLPPFGNWNQQLLGIAYILTPKQEG